MVARVPRGGTGTSIMVTMGEDGHPSNVAFHQSSAVCACEERLVGYLVDPPS